jgi:transposase
MDERVRFVARLLGGEKMAVLCREFDISRKTGYKIFQRYKDFGAVGLTDRSRRPYRQANQLPVQIETLIVRLRRAHPSWGAPKIREKLRRLLTMSRRRRSAPYMPCSIATAWSRAAADAATTKPRAPACPSRACPMICGAPITRASSCSPTAATATR